jgi:phospholipid-binding lipoprotein MlaA
MIIRTILALLLLLSVGGCAAVGRNSAGEIPPRHTIAEFRDQPFAYVYDPWERFNRDMYRFNYYFDKYLYLPVVNTYEFIAPIFVQNRITNFYNNIGEIRSLTNSVFQLKGAEAGITLGRFVTNSTIGLAGIFDPATKLGLERHQQDFGKTLGYYGVSSGPYIVLPVLGPSSGRDTTGLAVDGGIRYGIFTGVENLANGNSDDSFTIALAAETMEAIDARHQQTFRYYESGYPFEYYLVRFLYHQKRDLESGKQKTEPAP